MNYHLLSNNGEEIAAEISDELTVVEFMREWLDKSGLMSEFTGKHFDFVETVPLESGLFSNGVTKVREDIEGNKQYQANLMLLSGLHAFGDYDRLSNSEFMNCLTYSLDRIRNVKICEKEGGLLRNGIITRVQGSNGMLYSMPTGDVNDGVMYQLQIQVNYTIFS